MTHAQAYDDGRAAALKAHRDGLLSDLNEEALDSRVNMRSYSKKATLYHYWRGWHDAVQGLAKGRTTSRPDAE